MGKYLDSSVSILSGIGDTRAKALARMGIFTLRDLIYHIPRAYENRGNVKLLRDALDGESSAFVLTVATNPTNAITKKRMTITKFRAFDESGTVDVIFFNQAYIKDVFTKGAEFRFWGKLIYQNKKWQLLSPEFESIIPSKLLPDFIPVYPLTEGVNSKLMSKAVSQALSLSLPELEDTLPEEIRKKNSLPSFSFALKNIHDPESTEALRRAITRLTYEELFHFSVGLHVIKKRQTSMSAAPCKKQDLSPLCASLPYELTNAQKKVIDEITCDMTNESPDASPMSRILIGDVGSGKTVCAIAAIYTAVKSGMQASFLVPTEVLARQHYKDVSEILGKMGIRVSLLLGSTTASEKKKIYAALERDGDDRIDVIIGTHALLNDKVNFSELGLVITDEQHRFGVNQRAVLKKRNKGVHMLVMSATPIPRTLALALYGDLSISYIDEMPRGRQRVDTFVVDESYRARLNAFISKQVAEGGQAYIVCPSIEEADTESEPSIKTLSTAVNLNQIDKLKNVIEYFEQLKKDLPNLRISYLHGKMKPKEKDEVMRAFAEGKVDVLISTTVIEVGVNVPNASLMIIENAERFGLSQLHQLRGRVGRGTKKSYCILVSDSNGSTAKARLSTMKNTYDGYKIAEKDLEIRGPGDFFSSFCDDSIRQSGGISLRFSNLCNDASIMKEAFSDANMLLKDDPMLIKAEHAPLAREIGRLFNINEYVIS
ncbi:MAG: ATP-dependent DNA helicase RecG [Clostridia bacterium]|nr:ATP-dependent DNA helicase RecG [Clostridia bacterium]